MACRWSFCRRRTQNNLYPSPWPSPTRGNGVKLRGRLSLRGAERRSNLCFCRRLLRSCESLAMTRLLNLMPLVFARKTNNNRVTTRYSRSSYSRLCSGCAVPYANYTLDRATGVLAAVAAPLCSLVFPSRFPPSFPLPSVFSPKTSSLSI